MINKKDSMPSTEEVLRQQLEVEKDLHNKGQEEVTLKSSSVIIFEYASA